MSKKNPIYEGTVFGQLSVVGPAPSQGGRAHWNTTCTCGEPFVARGDRLLRGELTHCGCLKKNAPQASVAPTAAPKQLPTVAEGLAYRVSNLEDAKEAMQTELDELGEALSRRSETWSGLLELLSKELQKTQEALTQLENVVKFGPKKGIEVLSLKPEKPTPLDTDNDTIHEFFEALKTAPAEDVDMIEREIHLARAEQNRKIPTREEVLETMRLAEASMNAAVAHKKSNPT